MRVGTLCKHDDLNQIKLFIEIRVIVVHTKRPVPGATYVYASSATVLPKVIED